jgi:outer membrane protein insertion porin family
MKRKLLQKQNLRSLFYFLIIRLSVCVFFVTSSFAQEKEQEKKIVSLVSFNVGKVVTEKELESLSNLVIGKRLKNSLIDDFKINLENYYKSKGFYQTQINITYQEIKKNTFALLVEVQEGKPCLISNLEITEPTNRFKTISDFDKFNKKILEILNIKVGDRLDEQVLSEKLRHLKDWLVEKDYVLANVENVSYKFNDDFTKVDLKLNIIYGDPVSFGYSGNTVFSKSELDSFIAELRAAGLGTDYIGVITKKIIEEYKLKSYSKVIVKPSRIEKDGIKHITFYIQEGKRAKIDSLYIEGLSFENKKIVESIFRNKSSRLVQRNYFVEKDLDYAASLAIEELRARGFLQARLVSKNIQEVKKEKDSEFDYYVVSFQFYEGEQTIVSDINIIGNNVFSKEQILNFLKIQLDSPFNPYSFDEGLSELVSNYKNLGYLDFKIITPEKEIVQYTNRLRTAKIKLELFEGERIKIDNIVIEGLEKTKPYVVEREITFHKDDFYLAQKISETEDNIRRLGLFSDIQIKPVPSSRGSVYRNVVIELKEAEPGTIEIGPGFRTNLGFRAFTRLTYSNIAGKNWIGILGAQVNRRVGPEYRFLEYKLDSGFIEPRFLGSKYLYSIGISANKQRFPPDFNASSTQVSTGFERKFLNNVLTAKLYYKLERIRQFDVYINGIYSEFDNATLLIGSITPTLVFDTRDNPFVTTKGQLSTVSLEYAHPNFAFRTEEDPTAVGYSKVTASTHTYFPITKDIVWSNVFAGGFERSNIVGRAIPLIKLFRLGGWANLRGFREDSLNVDAIAIRGTLTYLNFRTQMDLPMVGDLKFSPFLDAGNLYVDRLQGEPFLRVGSGAGLHYMTPIGPINLDYGINLNPKGNEQSSQIHFSVGFI